MKVGRILAMVTGALMACAFLAGSLFAEVIAIYDDGTATGGDNPSEGTIMWDTFARNTDGYRGRYDEKLSVENAFLGSNTMNIAAILFNDLNARIGEGKKIVKATLALSCCNASSKSGKPVQVVAYPFIEEWNYSGFSWNSKMYREGRGEKFLGWNKESKAINPQPAPDTDADKDVYDFAEAHKGVKISATGIRPTTMKPELRMGDITEFDVTEVVKLWYSGELPNYGWALVASNPGTYVRFWASNAGEFDPRLTVEVESAEQAAPAVEPAADVPPTPKTEAE